MAKTVLLLVWLGLNAAFSEAQPKDYESQPLLAERLEKFENILLQQEQRIRLLEKEKLQLHNKVQLLTTETATLASQNKKLKEKLSSWSRAWPLVTQKLHNDFVEGWKQSIKAKKLAASPRPDGDRVVREVSARSDDPSAWESAVGQVVQKLNELTAEVQVLKNSQATGGGAGSGSSVYTRWGHAQCPNSTTLVYSGVIGGSYYGHVGAATNDLCLTLSPHLSDHPIPTYYGALYGAEYETFDTHENKDPVCAVCRSHNPTTIMVPGTNVCLPGWHLEYSGYLMAGHYGHQAGSQYICVDESLDSRDAGSANQNGRLLYFTVTACGSLPCDPYTNRKIVTCAVCSK